MREFLKTKNLEKTEIVLDFCISKFVYRNYEDEIFDRSFNRIYV